MKKVIFVFSLILAAMFILSGCSEKRAIERITHQNSMMHLIQQHSTVSLDISYLNMPDYYDITYSMKARQLDGQIEILDLSQNESIVFYRDERMHIFKDQKDFYTVIMSDIVYEGYTSAYLLQVDYYSKANYKLISSDTDKTGKTVVYSFEINDLLTEDFSLWGLSKGETIIMTYSLDNDWNILSQIMELDVKGKENLILLTKNIRYDDDFITDGALASYINATDTVKATLINTADESVIMEYKIPKNTYFGYDFTDTGMDLYYDLQCTKLYKHSESVIQNDVILYLGQSAILGQ